MKRRCSIRQQALAIRRSALGEAHPDTAASLVNVGGALGELGRHEEALQYDAAGARDPHVRVGRGAPGHGDVAQQRGHHVGRAGPP